MEGVNILALRTESGGKVPGDTSVAFIKKHALRSPSSVQYAISTLLGSQILTCEQEGIRIRCPRFDTTGHGQIVTLK